MSDTRDERHGHESHALIKEAFEGINKGDLDAVEKVVAPHLQAAVREQGNLARKAFPDLKLVLDDVVAGGDKIAIRWTAHGTFKGEAAHPTFGRVKPTGRHMQATGVTILRIEGGKVVDSWGATNELAVLKQLDIPLKIG
jgi:predicted ester cyclase